MNDSGELVGFALLTMVLGGVGLVAYALSGRQRMRELMMRERIALIERGVAPPPEVDPARFEHVVNVAQAARGSYSRSGRYRSAGILLMGLGLALFMIIGIAAGTPDVGMGVGGAFVMVGAAMVINAMFVARDPDPTVSDFYMPPPPKPPSGADSGVSERVGNSG